MRLLLISSAMIVAALSSGCLVREKVSENGEVISDRYKVEEPISSRTDPVR